MFDSLTGGGVSWYVWVVLAFVVVFFIALFVESLSDTIGGRRQGGHQPRTRGRA
jgi:hypothetical protein